MGYEQPLSPRATDYGQPRATDYGLPRATDYGQPRVTDYGQSLSPSRSSGVGVGLAEACRLRMEANRERCFGARDSARSNDVDDSYMVCTRVLCQPVSRTSMCVHVC